MEFFETSEEVVIYMKKIRILKNSSGIHLHSSKKEWILVQFLHFHFQNPNRIRLLQR